MLKIAFALAILLQPAKTMPLNPRAACLDARNRNFCADILATVDAVDPHAAMHHLLELTEEHGWPTASLVGRKASAIALEVIKRGMAERSEHHGMAESSEDHSRRAVARMWHGRVASARAEEYQAYLDHDGVQKLRAIKDNLGVQMFRRDLGDGSTEFIVISYWPNRDAIHAYAGADIEKTHFLPRDKEFLIDPDPNVRHYDILWESPGEH